MEIAYNNNEAKKYYQEMNSIWERCRPQTILIRDKGGNTVSNKEKVLQSWPYIMSKHCEQQMEWTMTMDTSGQYAYKLQKLIVVK